MPAIIISATTAYATHSKAEGPIYSCILKVFTGSSTSLPDTRTSSEGASPSLIVLARLARPLPKTERPLLVPIPLPPILLRRGYTLLKRRTSISNGASLMISLNIIFLSFPLIYKHMSFLFILISMMFLSATTSHCSIF